METVKVTPKKSPRYHFETQLKWTGHHTGMLNAEETPTPITVATPVEFGGEGNEWSPETLLLASVNSCFMSTFLVFAKKFGVNYAGISCRTTGEVEMVDGHFEFTTIDVFPRIQLGSADMEEKVKLALEKTEKYCLVSNSLKSAISYHGEWELTEKAA